MTCNLNTVQGSLAHNNLVGFRLPNTTNIGRVVENYTKMINRTELTEFQFINMIAKTMFAVLTIAPYIIASIGAFLADVTTITAKSFSMAKIPNVPPASVPPTDLSTSSSTVAPTKWEMVKNFINENQKPILAAIFISGLIATAVSLSSENSSSPENIFGSSSRAVSNFVVEKDPFLELKDMLLKFCQKFGSIISTTVENKYKNFTDSIGSNLESIGQIISSLSSAYYDSSPKVVDVLNISGRINQVVAYFSN